MRFYFFLSLVVILCCFNKRDSILPSIFTENENQRIFALIEYFEAQTMANCSASQNECYNSFFQQRVNTEDLGLNRNDFEVEIQKVKDILGTTFGEIFIHNPSVNNYRSQEPGKQTYVVPGLYPNYSGKYLELVRHVYQNTKNNFLKEYCKLILNSKIFTISSSISLMNHYSKLNFEEGTTKFLIIVHLFCLDKVDNK